MQSNNQPANGGAPTGGLNFVFESGSSVGGNQKYVRSHAAKVGWSQRARNKEAKKDDASNEKAPTKKRRRTKGQASVNRTLTRKESSGETVSTVSTVDSEDQSIASTTTATTASSSIPDSRISIQPQFHPSDHYTGPQDVAHSNWLYKDPRSSHHYEPSYMANHPSGQAVFGIAPGAPADSQYHSHGYNPAGFEPRSSMSYHSSQPLQSQTRRTSAQQMFPTRSDFCATMVFDDVSPMFNNGPYPQASTQSLPSPVPTPPSGDRAPVTPRASPPQKPSFGLPVPTASDTRKHAREELNEEVVESAELISRSPPPTRPASPYFLDVVMNPDNPLCPSVDAGSNTFGVFPVKWEYFFTPLMKNYRDNMLVQLEEITTGWSLNDRLDFNQMPLRLAMGEPALFYALLATAAIMMPPGMISPTIPQWLQSRTVTALNNAFADPSRATSDAIILTVNLIALFESTSGNAGVASTLHQPALRKMVDLRGGLLNLLNRPSRDCKNFVRFLAWTDRVIWCQTGNKLVFGEFKEDPSVAGTDWEDIWSRMSQRVEAQKDMVHHVEELPDEV